MGGGWKRDEKDSGAKAANKAAEKLGDKLKSSSPRIIFLISGVIFKLSMARALLVMGGICLFFFLVKYITMNRLISREEKEKKMKLVNVNQMPECIVYRQIRSYLSQR